jgi:PKD repeat protein
MCFYRYLNIFCFLIVLLGCNDDQPPLYLNVTGIEFEAHGSHDHFAEVLIEFHPSLIPVFNPDRPVEAPYCKWTFGDGTEAEGFYATHTYTQVGTYTVELFVDDGEKQYYDTTITIHSAPILKRENETSEQGKFLFQAENGDYQVLYSQGEVWKFLTITKDEEILNRKSISLNASRDFSSMRITKNGHLAGIDDHFWEIDMNGNVLHNKLIDDKNLLRYLTEDDAGLYYIIEEDGAKIVHLDSERNSTTLSVPGTNKPEYKIAGGQFIPPDRVRLNYKHQDPVLPFYDWMGTTAGEKMFERYNVYGDQYWSVSLPDGYLNVVMISDFGQRVYYYSKVNLQWQQSWPSDMNIEPYNNPSQEMPVEAFSKDGFTYIFSGNMNGVKIDSNGNTVWNKRFTYPFDRLNSVVINNKQNFVLLGTHYQYTDDYISPSGPTELITVEVDQNGNIVD